MNKTTAGYIAIILMLLCAGYFSLSRFFLQRQDHDILDIRGFPQKIGQWQGEDIELSEKEYQILETRNLIMRKYTNADTGRELYLFLIYSETNRSVFHPPEVCMQGGGMSFTGKTVETVQIDGKTATVNKINMEKDAMPSMALYCYKAGGLYTASYYLQQAYFAMHQFLNKRISGATIRVSLDVREGEDEAAATMEGFFKTVVGIIEGLTVRDTTA